jgi:drug/metabolite transporter (DMT)-like permease
LKERPAHAGKGKLVGELVALSNAAAWALTGVVAKGLKREVRPVHLVSAQAWATVLLFLAIALVIGQMDDVFRTPARSAIIFATGAVMNTFGSLAFWVAMSRGTVSTVYPTTQSIFILVSMVSGWLFLDDEFRVGVLGGAALIIGGVVLINWQRGEKPAGDSGSGVVAILLATVTSFLWAGAFVLTAEALADSDPVSATIIRNAVPALLFGAVAVFLPWSRLTRVYRGNWKRMAVGALLFAYGGYSFVLALDNASPGVVAILTNTAPVWAVALAWLVLRERLTRQMVAGLALSVIGIFVVLAFS